MAADALKTSMPELDPKMNELFFAVESTLELSFDLATTIQYQIQRLLKLEGIKPTPPLLEKSFSLVEGVLKLHSPFSFCFPSDQVGVPNRETRRDYELNKEFNVEAVKGRCGELDRLAVLFESQKMHYNVVKTLVDALKEEYISYAEGLAKKTLIMERGELVRREDLYSVLVTGPLLNGVYRMSSQRARAVLNIGDDLLLKSKTKPDGEDTSAQPVSMNHVVRLPSSNVYFKTLTAGWPVIESSVYLLSRILFGGGVTPSALLFLTNVNSQESSRADSTPELTSFAVSASLAVDGPLLEEVLESKGKLKYDLTTAAMWYILSLLTGAGDAKPDNFKVQEGTDHVIGIDCDNSFFPEWSRTPIFQTSTVKEKSVEKQIKIEIGATHAPLINAIFFYLQEVQEFSFSDKSHEQLKRLVTRQNSEALINTWVLAHSNIVSKCLQAVEDQSEVLGTFIEELGIIQMPPSIASNVKERLENIQKKLIESPDCKCDQLLEHIFPRLHRFVKRCVAKIDLPAAEVLHRVMSLRQDPLTYENVVSKRHAKEFEKEKRQQSKESIWFSTTSPPANGSVSAFDAVFRSMYGTNVISELFNLLLIRDDPLFYHCGKSSHARPSNPRKHLEEISFLFPDWKPIGLTHIVLEHLQKWLCGAEGAAFLNACKSTSKRQSDRLFRFVCTTFMVSALDIGLQFRGVSSQYDQMTNSYDHENTIKEFLNLVYYIVGVKTPMVKPSDTTTDAPTTISAGICCDRCLQSILTFYRQHRAFQMAVSLEMLCPLAHLGDPLNTDSDLDVACIYIPEDPKTSHGEVRIERRHFRVDIAPYLIRAFDKRNLKKVVGVVYQHHGLIFKLLPDFPLHEFSLRQLSKNIHGSEVTAEIYPEVVLACWKSPDQSQSNFRALPLLISVARGNMSEEHTACQSHMTNGFCISTLYEKPSSRARTNTRAESVGSSSNQSIESSLSISADEDATSRISVFSDILVPCYLQSNLRQLISRLEENPDEVGKVVLADSFAALFVDTIVFDCKDGHIHNYVYEERIGKDGIHIITIVSVDNDLSLLPEKQFGKIDFAGTAIVALLKLLPTLLVPQSIARQLQVQLEDRSKRSLPLTKWLFALKVIDSAVPELFGRNREYERDAASMAWTRSNSSLTLTHRKQNVSCLEIFLDSELVITLYKRFQQLPPLWTVDLDRETLPLLRVALSHIQPLLDAKKFQLPDENSSRTTLRLPFDRLKRGLVKYLNRMLSLQQNALATTVEACVTALLEEEKKNLCPTGYWGTPTFTSSCHDFDNRPGFFGIRVDYDDLRRYIELSKSDRPNIPEPFSTRVKTFLEDTENPMKRLDLSAAPTYMMITIIRNFSKTSVTNLTALSVVRAQGVSNEAVKNIFEKMVHLQHFDVSETRISKISGNPPQLVFLKAQRCLELRKLRLFKSILEVLNIEGCVKFGSTVTNEEVQKMSLKSNTCALLHLRELRCSGCSELKEEYLDFLLLSPKISSLIHDRNNFDVILSNTGPDPSPKLVNLRSIFPRVQFAKFVPLLNDPDLKLTNEHLFRFLTEPLLHEPPTLSPYPKPLWSNFECVIERLFAYRLASGEQISPVIDSKETVTVHHMTVRSLSSSAIKLMPTPPLPEVVTEEEVQRRVTEGQLIENVCSWARLVEGLDNAVVKRVRLIGLILDLERERATSIEFVKRLRDLLTTRLTHFALSTCFVQVARFALEQFTGSIRLPIKFAHLRTLKVSRCALNDNDSPVLVQLLSQMPLLTALVLRRNELGDVFCEQFANCWSKRSTLDLLDLSHNQIKSQGFKQISRLITLGLVKILNLSQNKCFENIQMEKPFRHPSNPQEPPSVASLYCLILSHNKLVNDGVEDLIDWISHHASELSALRMVDFSDNELNWDHSAKLIRALKGVVQNLGPQAILEVFLARTHPGSEYPRAQAKAMHYRNKYHISIHLRLESTGAKNLALLGMAATAAATSTSLTTSATPLPMASGLQVPDEVVPQRQEEN